CLDRVALGNVLVVAQHHRADGIALEVQRQAEGVAREFQHLTLHHVREAVDAADAVGHRDHGALRAHLGRRGEILDLALDQLADFGRVQLHGSELLKIREGRGRYLASVAAMVCSLPRTEASQTLSPTSTLMPPMRSGSTVTVALILRCRRAES